MFKNSIWVFVLVAIALAYSAAYGIDISMNVQELSYLNNQTVFNCSDAWGWYDASNDKYYALVCCDNQLVVIDATQPDSPNIVGAVSHGSAALCIDVKVVGDYVYAASRKDQGEIWIYYLPELVQDPQNAELHYLTMDDCGNIPGSVPLGFIETIFADDTYLIINELNASACDGNEIAILSLEDPVAPTLLSVWNQDDFNSIESAFWPHSAFLKDTTAYLFTWYDGVYQVEFDRQTGGIINWKQLTYDSERGDVYNNYPHTPPYFTCANVPPDTIRKSSLVHSGWLTDDGEYLLTSNEHPWDGENCNPHFAPCLRIWDVNSFYIPQNPDTAIVHPINAFDILWDSDTQADQYFVGAQNIDAQEYDTPCPIGDCTLSDTIYQIPNYFFLGMHNVLVKGGLAFMSWWARGLQVVDISDVNNITSSGYLDHGTGLNGDWAAEAFGVYPYSPDGNIYVSGESGLYICRYGYTGQVSTNTTWSGDVYVYDTLTVGSNIRLSISAGTNIYMFKNSLLKIDGKLIVNGTSGDSVKFLALGGNPQPGDWYGIKLGSSAACSLSYCSVGNAYYGIEMASSSNLRAYRSNFYSCDKRAIYNNGGTALVQYCRISNSDYGIYGYTSSLNRVENTYIKNIAANEIHNTQGRLYVNGCTLDSCSQTGLWSWSPSTPDTILNTTIKTRRYGIYWGGSNSVVIDGCTISNIAASGSYYGIYAYKVGANNPNIYSTGNTISNFNQIGIYLSQTGSNGIITKNEVTSCGTYGGYWYNSSTPINGDRSRSNKFQKNTYGLKLDYYSSVVVRRTKLWDNTSYGAYVASNSTGNFGVNTGTPPDSGLNSFKTQYPGMIYYDLYNAGINPVNAKLNYWGEVTPNASQIVNASYSPYLGADPLPRRESPIEDILPEDFALVTAYPNPFNPIVSIKFNLSSPNFVSIKIINILGQEVQTVLEEFLPAGENTVIWDGENRYGEHVSSGLYFCQLSTQDKQKTIKITALK